LVSAKWLKVTVSETV